MYAIKKGKKYVSKPGYKDSYTNDYRKVRRFIDRKEAQRNCCEENEIVVKLTMTWI